MSKEFLKLEKEIVEFVENNIDMITKTTYRVFTDGTKEQACSVTYPKPSDEPIEPPQPKHEPTNAEIYERLLITEENQTTIMLALAEIYENSIEV